MNENRKIDFKKYTLPKYRKMYLLKIAFYIIVVISMFVFIRYSLAKRQSNMPDKIEVDEFQLQTE